MDSRRFKFGREFQLFREVISRENIGKTNLLICLTHESLLLQLWCFGLLKSSPVRISPQLFFLTFFAISIFKIKKYIKPHKQPFIFIYGYYQNIEWDSGQRSHSSRPGIVRGVFLNSQR